MGGGLQEFRADLHIHSCLSPCASLDLSPRNIVQEAKRVGLDIIAVTDHNSAKNVVAVMKLAEELKLKVIPGMEVQTREEIHLLTLFPDWASAAAWDEEVRRNLPDIQNDPEVFGQQPIVDEEGNILRFEDRLLLNSIHFSLNEVKQRVERGGGLIIPAHFDKGSFSIISQLGLIPTDIDLEALEISRAARCARGNTAPAVPPSIPCIASSDAHELDEIGHGQTVFFLAEPTLAELRLAIHGREGRKVIRKMIDGQPVP